MKSITLILIALLHANFALAQESSMDLPTVKEGIENNLAAKFAERKPAKPNIGTFFVENAQFENSLQELNKTIKEDKKLYSQNKFVLAQHRIKKGEGLILAIRKYWDDQYEYPPNKDGWRTIIMGDESFQKITLHFPVFIKDGVTKRTFIKDEFEGFISSGSSTWLGGGAYGVIQDGSIKVKTIDADRIEFEFDLKYDKIITHENHKIMSSQDIKEKYIVLRKEFEKLTAWDGKAGVKAIGEKPGSRAIPSNEVVRNSEVKEDDPLYRWRLLQEERIKRLMKSKETDKQ